MRSRLTRYLLTMILPSGLLCLIFVTSLYQEERALFRQNLEAAEALRRGDREAAERYLDKALGLDGDHLLALRTLANFFCSDMQRCLEDGSAACATMPRCGSCPCCSSCSSRRCSPSNP